MKRPDPVSVGQLTAVRGTVAPFRVALACAAMPAASVEAVSALDPTAAPEVVEWHA